MTNIVPWLCSEKLKFWQLFIQLPYKGKCLQFISGGGGSVLSPAMVAMCSSGSNPRWEWKFTPKSCPYTNFFSSIQSRQLFIPIGCFCWVLGRHWNWEPGAFSIARQTQELNGAVTGRWCSTVTVRATLFYLKQIDCLSVHFSSYFKKLILP